ncbi:sensor domain-containing diguanylate cyclase [Photobacterium sagamiensis]|uniref:sensor domain-containing diguanylate cyclase n=1 Tax=Photobacterium sagamiensis TaxID=2910241 RepID=UPI003D0CF783
MNLSPAINEQQFIKSHYGVVIHRDFKALYADDNYARYFGYQSGQDILSLTSLLQLIAPHERQNAIHTYNAVMAGKEQPGVRSYKNIDKNENEFIVLTVDHVIEWQGEKAMQITIIDLSTHVETHRKLQASEERYRELIDGSIQGIVVHQNFKPLFCNQAYAQMLGFEDDQALMDINSILPLISSRYHQQAHQDNHALLSGEKDAIKTEVKGLRADGSTVWLSILSRPVQWDGERVVQVTAMDITEQHLLSEQLEHRANYDGLTNLLNRRALSELLTKQFAYHQTHSNPLCCVLIDLDNFKAINDQYGHHVGDIILKVFASISKKNIRESDIICRWGGEEFVLILPNTDIEQAEFIAERLCDAITKLRVATSSGHVSFSASMGVSSLSNNTSNVDLLLSKADNALYQAKHQGKNRVVIAS